MTLGQDNITLPAGYADWEQLMTLALTEAARAKEQGEVPVGAIVLGPDGHILGRAGNSPVSRHDPTAHAEILALRQACQLRGNYRLPDAIVVVTLEPCLMCLGALVQARVAGLVFGATDPKAGAVLSRLAGADLDFLNHRLNVLSGVLDRPCSELLSAFFQDRRANRPAIP